MSGLPATAGRNNQIDSLGFASGEQALTLSACGGQLSYAPINNGAE